MPIPPEEFSCSTCQKTVKAKDAFHVQAAFCRTCGEQLVTIKGQEFAHGDASYKEMWDIDTIGSWLESVSQATGSSVEVDRSREGEGVFLWDIRVPGCEWRLRVEYQKSMPSVVALVAVSLEYLGRAFAAKDELAETFAQHGLQAGGMRVGKVGNDADDGAGGSSWWGCLQLFSTAPLNMALFNAAVSRMSAAMKDAARLVIS